MSRNSTAETYKKNLFAFFKVNELSKCPTSVNVLKNSKMLILNNSNYKNYSDYYKNATTIHTFKLPNVSTYPLQRNEELISLQSNLTKKQRKQYQAISLVKRSKMMSSTSSSFFRRKKEEDAKDKMEEKNFLKCIDQFNNMNSVIYKYISYKEKYFINKKGDNNLHLLIEMLKRDISGKEEKKIINEFDISDKRIHVKLQFHSLKLVFYNDSKVNSIEFPFSFLPFFYGLRYDLFNTFISLVIDYNKSNNKFELNREKFRLYYKIFKDNYDFYTNESYMQSNKRTLLYSFDWIIKSNDDTSKFNMKLIPPYISFKLSSLYQKISVRKTIDIAHCAYFIENSFKDWNFYVMNSFCIYRKFRDIVNKALSFVPSHKENIKIDFDITNSKLHHDTILNESHEFFISYHNRTFFYKFKAPKIKIVFADKVNDYTKEFQLNLKQAIQLNKFSFYCSIKEIIKKGLDIVKENQSVKNIELNINDLIFNFDESLLTFFQPLSSRDVEGKSLLSVVILDPLLEWQEYTDEESKRKIFTVKESQSKKLLGLDKSKWSDFISNIIDDINNNSVIYGSASNLSNESIKVEDSIKQKSSNKLHKASNSKY